jgi:hypothetical protein
MYLFEKASRHSEIKNRLTSENPWAYIALVSRTRQIQGFDSLGVDCKHAYLIEYMVDLLVDEVGVLSCFSVEMNCV